jgi:hypothetical protein
MIVAFVLSTLLAASGAPADQAAPATAGAHPAAKPGKADDKDRMVCRRDEQETGSHRVLKICHTKAEWDQMSDDARRMFREGGVQAVDRSVANASGGMGAPH